MTFSRPAVAVARGASYLILLSIVNLVVGLAAFAVIARAITRADMGSLAVLTLVASGAQVIAGLGVGSTTIRFVASLQGQGDHENMSRAGYSCLIINASMTAVIVSVVFFSSTPIALLLLGTSSRGNLFRLLSWEIAALGVNYSLGSLLVGLKRFREYSLASIAAFAVRQSAVVSLLILGIGLPGILIGWGVGDSLNSLLLAALARKALGPFKLGFGFTKLMRFSAPLFLEEAATYVWTSFDRILLLPLVSLAQLGAYNVAVTAYGVLSAVPSSISSSLFPFYSYLYADGTKASGTSDLGDAVRTASRYVSFLTIPLAIGLAVTSFPTVTLLAGTNYVDAAYPLAALSLFLAMACLLRALSGTFVVMGKTVTSGLVTVASILLPILMGLLIIPHLGIIGASIVRGVSLLIAFALSIGILRRKLKLRFDTVAYGFAWLASIVMAVVVLTFEVAIYSKYLLPFYAAVGAAVWVLVLRLSKAVNDEDLELLSEFLGPRLTFVSKWLSVLLGVKPSSSTFHEHNR